MYSVRVRIRDYRTAYEAHEDFATLYRAARTLVKFGKRHGIRTSLVISDWRTGNTIVRLYSFKRDLTGEWVAAQSSVGKYHTHIQF